MKTFLIKIIYIVIILCVLKLMVYFTDFQSVILGVIAVGFIEILFDEKK